MRFMRAFWLVAHLIEHAMIRRYVLLLYVVGALLMVTSNVYNSCVAARILGPWFQRSVRTA